MSGRMD